MRASKLLQWNNGEGVPLGLEADGTVIFPNRFDGPWWERLAWGAYGRRGWGAPLLYAGKFTNLGTIPVPVGGLVEHR